MPLPQLFCLSILCLCACKKAEPLPPSGQAVENLVSAANAPLFEFKKGSFTEAVFEQESWTIHDLSGHSQSDKSKQDTAGQLKAAKEKSDLLGSPATLLISAPAHARFRTLRSLIRNAARVGFPEVWFLTANHSRPAEIRAFHLGLPLADGSPPPTIEPLMIRISEEDAISTGAGGTDHPLDKSATNSLLPKLSHQLELYSSAARAASVEPHVRIYADSDCSYQRLIDVMSRLHASDITHIRFTDLMDGSTTCEGMNFEREKRLELLKTKAASPPTAPRPGKKALPGTPRSPQEN